MNYQELCNQLSNKLLFDQNKLNNKKQELIKLNKELSLVEEQCTIRNQLNMQINEKIRLIDVLFEKMKKNFEQFSSEIDDLDRYSRQALENKHKFNVPFDQFKTTLENNFTSLSNEINEKVNYVKEKYKIIIDRLKIKKADTEREANESLSKYEDLKRCVLIENENIVKLEAEIENKHNQIQEYTNKIVVANEDNKKLEMKIESILNENQEINKKISDLNVQYKKVDEDKRSIESKIKMQDELIECTKLMIEELENNVLSNPNYNKYKDEYDQVEKEIKQLEKELEDRSKIYEMKKQCQELKERKIKHVNQILFQLKSIESKQNLSEEEMNAEFRLVVGEIENEIKLLESELDNKGLLNQMNQTDLQQDESRSQSAGYLTDNQIDNENLNEFQFVPNELLPYVQDNQTNSFETQMSQTDSWIEDNKDEENKIDESLFTNLKDLTNDLSNSNHMSIELKSDCCDLDQSNNYEVSNIDYNDIHDKSNSIQFVTDEQAIMNLSSNFSPNDNNSIRVTRSVSHQGSSSGSQSKSFGPVKRKESQVIKDDKRKKYSHRFLNKDKDK